MKPITVRLCGGLGNQMFQYAVARSLALRHHAPLNLDISALAHDSKRKYALAPFAIEAEVIFLRCWPRWWYQMRGRIYREKGFFYDSSVGELFPGVILEGYFQSEKYFAFYATTIRREFSLKGSLSQPAQEYLAHIESVPHSVAVHVRRGDYVSDRVTQMFHGTCSWEYYEQAMQLIRDRVRGARFFFFSDEPKWLLARQVNGAVIEGLPPQEDMFLMSRCRHQIIANSSFSWWGAWLNRNPDKIVIAPKRWFANEKMERQTGDLIPSDWIRL